MIATFLLDGVKGTIDEAGFITWASIHCHINSLKPDSELSKAAINALELANPFDR